MYGLLASFFLFTSFILELFVMIGQLFNKPFLNMIYFVQANNLKYNLSFSFGLWSYCQGQVNAPIQQCSKPVTGYNWAETPGFNQMLPNSDNNLHSLFLAHFILYFIGLIFSFLLWLIILISCLVYHRQTLNIIITSLTAVNFLIMLTALILSLVLVIGSVKKVSGATFYWNGHAGLALWFTIASVVALFMATICHLLKECYGGDVDRGSDRSDTTTATFHDAYQDKPFDLAPHQPDPIPIATPTTALSQRPSLSRQYSPGLHVSNLRGKSKSTTLVGLTK